MSATAGASHSSATHKKAEQVYRWFKNVQPDYKKVQADLNASSVAARAGTESALNAACTGLTTDVQALQTKPPAPDVTINTPFQAALTSWATASSLCSSGIQQDTGSLISQSSADITTATSETEQATSQIKALEAKLK
jgi:hypothetical protein